PCRNPPPAAVGPPGLGRIRRRACGRSRFRRARSRPRRALPPLEGLANVSQVALDLHVVGVERERLFPLFDRRAQLTLGVASEPALDLSRAEPLLKVVAHAPAPRPARLCSLPPFLTPAGSWRPRP